MDINVPSISYFGATYLPPLGSRPRSSVDFVSPDGEEKVTRCGCFLHLVGNSCGRNRTKFSFLGF